jgi:hypothetical protein
MNFKKYALLLLFLPAILKAESQAIPGFRGLHNSEAALLINDDEAQDLQDVDLTSSGKGVKKRDGYAQFNTVGVSTIGVRGGYYYRNTGGSPLLIHANNQSIFKSADGAAYSAFVTTDTAGSYYDFTDSQGYLWRANSSRDQILKYDGTTVTYYPLIPQGDQVEAMPGRLVVSGTSANPNRINFSSSADFPTFTTGLLETDPFYEDIGLPGQNVNAIKYAFGRLLIWTRDTFSHWYGSNQYDGVIEDVSTTLGTYQPNSIVSDLGKVYWQAQDKHFYSYDGNMVENISEVLDVSSFAGGESKTWSQTTQDDFDSGTDSQTTSAITAGDVMLSTWTDTDTTTADFSAGTTNNTSVINNRVYLSTNNTNIDNHSIETGSGTDAASWTVDTAGGAPVQRVGTAVGASGCTGFDTSPYDGSWMFGMNSVCTSGTVVIVYVQDVNGNDLTSANVGYSERSCSQGWGSKTLDLSSHAGKWVRIKIKNFTSDPDHIEYSDYFLCSGGTITFRNATNFTSAGCRIYLDAFENGRSSILSGTFTSAAFDTTFESSATWLASGANWTTNSHAISLQTQSSSDGSSWTSAVAWSTGSVPSSAYDRYLRYVATISTGGTTNGTALPYIDDVTFNARASTGTFISQTKNIGSAATSFGNFSADETLDGGTLSYSIRTAMTESALSTTSWTTLTDNAQVSATIRPWIQVKADFATTGVQNPSLQNFTVNWNEGSIVRTFGTVDKDHRILWSVGDGATTVANKTYIYDPRFKSWLKYSFAMDAPARVGSSIYFGNPSSGTVYNWPSGTSDAGSAITSYWKSKDFVGVDPFSEKNYQTFSFLGKTQTGSNLDFTYTVDVSSSVATNYTLTDPFSVGTRRINDRFPSGEFGSFINFKFGNNDADAPFELYGFKYDYTLRPWRVME